MIQHGDGEVKRWKKKKAMAAVWTGAELVSAGAEYLRERSSL